MPLIPPVLFLRPIRRRSPDRPCLRCLDCPGEYLVISTWNSLDDWNRWLSSEERKNLQKQIDSLLGEETQALLVGAFRSAHVGDEAGGCGGHRGAVRIIRGVGDHMTEQIDRDLRVDRESHPQPYAVSQRDQRIGLVALERLMGMLLIALAVQMLLEGVSAYLAELA